MNRREVMFGATYGLLGLGTLTVAKGEESKNIDVVKILTNVCSAMQFSDFPIPEEDLMKILQIGLNAPSGHNLQPWFLSVVTDRVLLANIDKAAGVGQGRLSLTGSPTVIFVCIDNSSFAEFGAGTICDRMTVAANLMGYGAKTVMTPCKVANEQFKDKLGIPKKYSINVALLLGTEISPSVDGVSGATSREPLVNKVVRIR